jgi:hypothetical protein
VILQLGQPDTSITKAHHIAHSTQAFGEKYLILYMIQAMNIPKSIADIAVKIISAIRKLIPRFHLISSISTKK